MIKASYKTDIRLQVAVCFMRLVMALLARLFNGGQRDTATETFNEFVCTIGNYLVG